MHKRNYFLCFLFTGIFFLLLSGKEITDHTNFRQDPAFLESIDLEQIDQDKLSAAVFYATNEQRAKYKLKPLAFHPLLQKMALLHSANMREYGFFSHTDPKNKQWRETENRATYVGIKNPYIAENIAVSFGIQYKAGASVYPVDPTAGTFSYKYDGPLIPNHTYLSFADQVLNQWMNSSGHRANILNKEGLELGCGMAFFRDKKFYNMPKFYCTQNFQWFHKIEVASKENTEEDKTIERK